MLRREDNELLTRVGPGTVMGSFLREYWVPAWRSDAVIANGAPVRVRLFGENFVAFRGEDGVVGFLDEACPHRRASLALARNEDNALHCIFHAWKINAAGCVLDTPCEPPARRAAFAANIKVRHFPVREAGGMIWVYLGSQSEPPAFPEFEFNTLPASHVFARRAPVHYNWLQGLEAHLDASHVGVLHSGHLKSGRRTGSLVLTTNDVAPRTEMVPTNYGLREGAVRDWGDGTTYARIREVVLPFFVFIAQDADQPGSGRATIPIDDEWDAEWYIHYDLHKPLTREFIESTMSGTSGDPNNWASNLGTVENMWHQDRDAMQTHWSGITSNIPFEDFVIEASMGPLVDRSLEQLGAADVILVRVRQQLLDAVQAFQRGEPLPWRTDVDFSRIRALATMMPSDTDWRSVDTIDYQSPIRPVAAE